MSGGSVPVVGLERSGIPSTALVAGRKATITGIVKRAYPSASDQRLSIVPRGTVDIVLGAAPQPTGHPSGPSPKPGSSPSVPAHAASRPPGSPDAAEYLVGGTVTSIEGTVLVLTDASGAVTIQLVGEAAALAETLHVGDLVNATGIMNADGHLIVNDPGSMVRLASLGSGDPRSADPTDPGDPASLVPQALQQAAHTPQMTSILAFGALFGLTVVVVIGAFAVRLYGPNRVREWPNRVKRRIVRI